MSVNNLLIWISARNRGSWSQFRSAVEQFHVEHDKYGDNGENIDDTTKSELPVYQRVRFGLQRLAHVEFSSPSEEADWRVVPPSLAIHIQDRKWLGVLCGARSPELLENLNNFNGNLSIVSEEIPGMPDRILMTCADLNTLVDLASDEGIAFQVDAPASVLTAIPSVDDLRCRFPAEPPEGPGWVIEKFSTSKLGWKAAESGDLSRVSTGLFRFRMKYQQFYLLRWRGGTFKVQVQVGKYAVLRHRRVRGLLQYNFKQKLLSVPLSCRPPLLIERALVLCTGLLPKLEKDSGRLVYTEIPIRVARIAAELLRQEIQIQ